MKAALIPPVSGLKRFGGGGFHLLLSHLLENPRYFEHYRMARSRGAYLVLDNSAHENGEGNDPELLVYQARSLDAQEIVVPDVLDKSDETIEAAISAHEAWYEMVGDSVMDPNTALMYVPQGENYEAWKFCLENLVRIHLFMSERHAMRRDFVIGISKDYECWEGGLMRLLDDDVEPLRNDLQHNGIRMNVHMLGWGRDLWALEAISAKHKWIRSTDSAKPFVYALDGTNLWEHVEGVPPQYPKRPEGYFNMRMHTKSADLAVANAMLFRALASGHRSNTVMV